MKQDKPRFCLPGVKNDPGLTSSILKSPCEKMKY